jgi:hypothetical protein
MLVNVYTVSIIFSVTFLLTVIGLVKKNRLHERYSILWIIMSLVLLVLSISPLLMEKLAGLLGIKNPPSLLFLFGLVYLIIYNLHITTVVSKQSEKITRLAQEMAILKAQKNIQRSRP